MSYYFAFGSNLDSKQMKRRCPRAREVNTARVYGYALRFVGWSRGWGGAVADIAKRRGARTEGVLYELPYVDLKERMDRFEGCPHVYKRVRVNARLPSGRAVRAWTYVKAGNREHGVPSVEYFTAIWNGYESRYIDPQPLLDAVAAEVTRATRRRPRRPRQATLFV